MLFLVYFPISLFLSPFAFLNREASFKNCQLISVFLTDWLTNNEWNECFLLFCFLLLLCIFSVLCTALPCLAMPSHINLFQLIINVCTTTTIVQSKSFKIHIVFINKIIKYYACRQHCTSRIRMLFRSRFWWDYFCCCCFALGNVVQLIKINLSTNKCFSLYTNLFFCW